MKKSNYIQQSSLSISSSNRSTPTKSYSQLKRLQDSGQKQKLVISDHLQTDQKNLFHLQPQINSMLSDKQFQSFFTDFILKMDNFEFQTMQNFQKNWDQLLRLMIDSTDSINLQSKSQSIWNDCTDKFLEHFNDLKNEFFNLQFKQTNQQYQDSNDKQVNFESQLIGCETSDMKGVNDLNHLDAIQKQIDKISSSLSFENQHINCLVNQIQDLLVKSNGSTKNLIQQSSESQRKNSPIQQRVYGHQLMQKKIEQNFTQSVLVSAQNRRSNSKGSSSTSRYSYSATQRNRNFKQQNFQTPTATQNPSIIVTDINNTKVIAQTQIQSQNPQQNNEKDSSVVNAVCKLKVSQALLNSQLNIQKSNYDNLMKVSRSLLFQNTFLVSQLESTVINQISTEHPILTEKIKLLTLNNQKLFNELWIIKDKSSKFSQENTILKEKIQFLQQLNQRIDENAESLKFKVYSLEFCSNISQFMKAMRDLQKAVNKKDYEVNQFKHNFENQKSQLMNLVTTVRNAIDQTVSAKQTQKQTKNSLSLQSPKQNKFECNELQNSEKNLISIENQIQSPKNSNYGGQNQQNIKQIELVEQVKSLNQEKLQLKLDFDSSARQHQIEIEKLNKNQQKLEKSLQKYAAQCQQLLIRRAATEKMIIQIKSVLVHDQNMFAQVKQFEIDCEKQLQDEVQQQNQMFDPQFFSLREQLISLIQSKMLELQVLHQKTEQKLIQKEINLQAIESQLLLNNRQSNSSGTHLDQIKHLKDTILLIENQNTQSSNTVNQKLAQLESQVAKYQIENDALLKLQLQLQEQIELQKVENNQQRLESIRSMNLAEEKSKKLSDLKQWIQSQKTQLDIEIQNAEQQENKLKQLEIDLQKSKETEKVYEQQIKLMNQQFEQQSNKFISQIEQLNGEIVICQRNQNTQKIVKSTDNQIEELKRNHKLEIDQIEKENQSNYKIIQEQSKKIGELRDKIEFEVTQSQNLHSKVQKLEEENSQLQLNFQSSIQENQFKQTNIVDEYESRIEELCQKLKFFEQTKEQLTRDRYSSEDKMNKIEVQAHVQRMKDKDEISQIKLKLSQSESQLNELQKSEHNLQSQYQISESKLQQCQLQLTQYKTQIKELNEQITLMFKQIDEQKTQQSRLNIGSQKEKRLLCCLFSKSRQVLQIRIDQAQQDLDLKISDNKRITAELNALQNKFTQIETKQELRDQLLFAQFKKKEQEQQNQINNGNELLQQMKIEVKRVQELTETKEAQQNMINDLKKQVSTLMKSAVEGRQKLIKEHQIEITKLQEQITKPQSLNQAYDHENNFEKQVKELQTEQLQYQELIQTLKANIEQLTTQNNADKQNLEQKMLVLQQNKESDEVQKQSELNSLQDLLKQQKQSHEEALKQVKIQSFNEISQINIKLTAAYDQIRRSEQNIDELHQSLTQENKLAVQNLQAEIISLQTQLQNQANIQCQTQISKDNILLFKLAISLQIQARRVLKNQLSQLKLENEENQLLLQKFEKDAQSAEYRQVQLEGDLISTRDNLEKYKRDANKLMDQQHKRCSDLKNQQQLKDTTIQNLEEVQQNLMQQLADQKEKLSNLQIESEQNLNLLQKTQTDLVYTLGKLSTLQSENRPNDQQTQHHYDSAGRTSWGSAGAVTGDIEEHLKHIRQIMVQYLSKIAPSQSNKESEAILPVLFSMLNFKDEEIKQLNKAREDLDKEQAVQNVKKAVGIFSSFTKQKPKNTMN